MQRWPRKQPCPYQNGNAIFPSFAQGELPACSHHMWVWEDPGRGQATATSPSTAASMACFWSPQEPGLIWLPPNFAERVLPNFLAHLEDPAALLWEDQEKILRVSRACVTPPQPSTFYTGLNFLSLCRNSALCTRILPESYIIKNKFFFHLPPATPAGGILHGSPCSVGSLWAGGAGLGAACVAEAEVCLCMFGGWGKVHGQVTAPAFFLSPSSSGGPQREQPMQGGTGRAAAAVFGFPLVPGI